MNIDHAISPSNIAHALYFCAVSQSRTNAGLVCRLWSRSLYWRSLWSHLRLNDDTLINARLCRTKYNYYADEEEVWNCY